MKCDACEGRGWQTELNPPDSPWPIPCTKCGGIGRFTYYGLGKRLNMHPRTLRRVNDLRSRPSTCERVLEGLGHLRFQPAKWER